MTDERHPQRLIAPRQERSQITLDRLLDATEELLEEHAWGDITVAAIVGWAKSSVGSFYARFPSKDALVVALLERYHEELRASVGNADDTAAWHELPLEDRARQLIEGVVSTCRRKRGLLRLRLQRRLAGTPDAAFEQQRDRHNVDQLERLFESCRQQIGHEDYLTALRFALRMVDAVVVSALALDDVTSSYGAINDQTLVDELTSAFVAYLTSPNRS